MTVEALQARAARTFTGRIDSSRAVMTVFAAILCLLIVLPI